MRSQFQQPLCAELLPHQQQLQQQHLAESSGAVSLLMNSPSRIGMNPYNRQQLLTQSIVHQTYGVQPQVPSPQNYIMAHYQNQQSTSNMQLRQLQSSTIPSNYSPPPSVSNQVIVNRNLACSQMPYRTQLPNSSETILQFQPTTNPKFPPSISVNQLAPQVSFLLKKSAHVYRFPTCRCNVN